MKHIVSFSGGKDSTAMLLMMIEKNMPIDDIVFCDTMAEYPEMYEYIDEVEKYIGRKITRIRAKKTYEEQFYTKFKRGKNKGRIYGFPFQRGPWCNSRLKMRPFEQYYKSIDGEYCVYLGIAYDEPKRYARKKDYQIMPLHDWKITEAECKKYLEKKDLINNLYDWKKRTGCWFCHNQSVKDLRALRDNYPKLWDKLLEMDNNSPVTFKPDGTTVADIEKKFEYEDRQINVFDLLR